MKREIDANRRIRMYDPGLESDLWRFADLEVRVRARILSKGVASVVGAMNTSKQYRDIDGGQSIDNPNLPMRDRGLCRGYDLISEDVREREAG